MTIPKLGQLVLVSWVDIQTDHSWAASNAALGPAKCMTAGYVTSTDDASITLAACVGQSINAALEQEVNLRMCIPIGCITSWAPLRVGKTAK
jgi:hypothetical protein